MRIPLWLAAVLPAALIAHGCAYALAGDSLANGAHAWVAPAAELSTALLLTLAGALAGGTLLRLPFFQAGCIERSASHLWPRLAIAQTLVYAIAEHAEGTHATIIGVVLQVVVAVLAACVLAVFARLLDAAGARMERALGYRRRLLAAASFAARTNTAPVFALAVASGHARFQRPPPSI